MEENIFIKSESEEEEYLGNIWGWKFSFISLALIIIVGAFTYLSELNEDGSRTIPSNKEKLELDTFKLSEDAVEE